MNYLQIIESFLNNQSVSAFVGAFSAFVLVVLNDWRRDRRKVRNIKGEIAMNRSHAQDKLEMVRRNRAAIRELNEVVPAPILRFNTAVMKQVSAQVLDLLTPDQRRAIEALCYNMEATDDVLAEGYDLARELAGTLSIKADRVAGPDVLLKIYDDAIVNLKRLIEMCDYYLERRYLIILTKQYNRLDYEEL